MRGAPTFPSERCSWLTPWPLLGGFLAEAINYRLVFGLSGVGRLLGMGLFLWLTVQGQKVVRGGQQ